MSFFYLILMRRRKPNEAFKITKLTILIMITVLKNQRFFSIFFYVSGWFFIIKKSMLYFSFSLL